jgi:hypothetical protein
MYFTISILFFLLVTILGTVVYVYLRREQDKIISKDKYDFSTYASDSPKRLLDPSKSINSCSCAGLAGLITSIGLLFLWFPVAFIMAIGLDGGSSWFIDAGGYFIGFLFLVSLFLLAGGVLEILPITNRIFATIHRMLNKIYYLYTYKTAAKIAKKNED